MDEWIKDLWLILAFGILMYGLGHVCGHRDGFKEGVLQAWECRTDSECEALEAKIGERGE